MGIDASLYVCSGLTSLCVCVLCAPLCTYEVIMLSLSQTCMHVCFCMENTGMACLHTHLYMHAFVYVCVSGPKSVEAQVCSGI